MLATWRQLQSARTMLECIMPAYICFRLKIASTQIRTQCFCAQQLLIVCNALSDVFVFHLQTKSQPDASGELSKRAGSNFLLNKSIFGTSDAGSGIPADYGAAPGNPTLEPPPPTPAPAVSSNMASTDNPTPLNTGDGAVAAVRSSGEHIGMAGDALTPSTQEVLNNDASTHVQESGSVPITTTTITHHLTDAHANPITPAPNMEVTTGERPEEIIEEVVPVSNERLEENRLAVVIQQLLKMVEAAANPAQGTHFHLISVNVNKCLLPGDKGAELAVLLVDGFLVSVDVFQQEGKFIAAFTLMAKVSYASVDSKQRMHENVM